MLTNADRELITAAVDGELSPERQAAFHSLLSRDPAAATLYARLKTDSRRIRALPITPAPAKLADTVAARVVALPRAIPVAPRSPTSRNPRWAPYAVAASLLVAVAAASFWVSLVEDADSTRTRQLAQKQRLPRPDPDDRLAHSTPAIPTELGTEIGPSPRQVLPQDGGSGDSRLAVTPPAADTGSELAPSPRTADAGDRLGSGQLNVIPPFESVEARLPVLTPVPELARKDIRDRIVSDLGRDPAFRLDLFVRDVPRAAAVFQSAARTAGWRITVDSTAQDLLRKKVTTQLAVYTDSLTPDEIARFLAVLAKRDQADKSGPVFTIAHLVPFQPAEQRDLRDLFGVDLGLGKRKAGGTKPVARADEKKAAKPAIVLTYTPLAFRVNPAVSKEIRAFLEQRTEHKPAGVPLLVVIRPVN